MKKIFSDVLAVDGVEGVVLLSFEGQVIHKEFSSPPAKDPKVNHWSPFIRSIKDMREAELVFEKKRFYVRKTNAGFLLIVMAPLAASAMVRLNCDVILPNLKASKGAKGIGGVDFRL